jgi:uncharacterized protein (DUF58 family)
MGRARRLLRPPRRLRPTRAGWCFFLLVFGVGFAALNTGNNLLYMVLALMLAFLVLSGLLSEATLRGIRVRRRVPGEIFAERAARVLLEIHNDQSRAVAFAVVVEDRADSGSDAGTDHAAGRCFALRIAPGAREVRSYSLRAERRGELRFRGYVVFTRFPFGLFSKSLLIEDHETLLVYPPVDRLSLPRRDAEASREGDTRDWELAGSSPVAAGLRSFAPGDPRRRIHWQASQRAGSLLVRDLESECDQEVRVRLHTGGRPGAGFEGRVRRAASEVVALLDAGRRVGLDAGGREFAAGSGAGHRAALLGFLARVQPGASETA